MWCPAIQESHRVGTPDASLGRQRECHVTGFGRLIEHVTEWDEGRRLGYTSSGPRLMRSMTMRYALSPAGLETRVTFDVEVQMRFGPLGRILERAIARPRVTKLMATTLVGLKQYVEHKEPPPALPRPRAATERILPRGAPVAYPQRRRPALALPPSSVDSSPPPHAYVAPRSVEHLPSAQQALDIRERAD